MMAYTKGKMRQFFYDTLADCPVIAGGLIADKADIIVAIEAGAISISSTNQNTWFI